MLSRCTLLTAIFAIALTASSVHAGPVGKDQRQRVKPLVRSKIESSIAAIYQGHATLVTIRAYGYFPERGDAGRAIPPSEVEQLRVDLTGVDASQDPLIFGASSPTRVDPVHTQRSVTMNDLINQELRIRRAQFMNNATGRQCVVVEDGIENDTTVVYIAIVARSPGVPSKVPGGRERSPAPSQVITVLTDHAPVWLRPSIGAALLTTDPVGFVTPLVGLTAGARIGKTDLSIYAMEGQDFQPDNRGLCRYGLQLGDEFGWAWRLGYQSDWTEIRGDGHTDRRREGGEVGLSYGTGALSVSGYLNLGWYADRRDRDGRIEPGLSLALTFGPVFRSKN